MFAKLYAWRWLIWGAYILAWTAALLAPIPEHGPWDVGEGTVTRKMLIAKGLHISAYTVLTILTAWLRLPSRYRFVLAFLLMAHATLSEVLQYEMSDFAGRSGDLMDVALDNCGIAIGILLTWKWWTQASGDAQ